MSATLTIASTIADENAATLRDRRAFDHGPQRCDAFDPCDECKAKRRSVRATRAVAAVPRQR